MRVNELAGLIRSIGVARLAAIIGVTMGVAAALALIIARIGEPPMTVLYADLSLRDAQAVIQRLDQDGARYTLRDSGGRVAVLAPRSDAARLKTLVAADGLTIGGGVGYELFDKDDSFGATTFQQNINRLRALEGELSRSISSIAGVRAARVHLVLPERELFSRDRKQASASIVIDAPGGLDRRAVRAIVNLAASAAPDLSPSRVTVLDASGALLASGESDDALASGAEERVAATEMRVRRMVEDIVGRIVGPENLRVQVAADIDFARVTENAEIIDPDSQTVLSSSLIEETGDSRDPALGRAVTVANALPGAEDRADAGGVSTSSNRRIEETTNYEISRTVRSEIREQGGVKRLSVAVALNNANGARAPEDIARIEALVRSAIGYSEARGDSVDVVEIAFQPLSAAALAAPAGAGLDRALIMRVGEIAALVIIAVALVVFVLRPMLAAPTDAAPRSPAPQLAAPANESRALPDSGFETRLDLARVEGQVKASSLGKVTEVVKGHTDESAGILKGWIRQAS